MGEVIFENGKPYLQEHAITNIAWNEETRELYELHHAEGLKFKNIKTLFGEVMVTKGVVISNDAPNDPRGTGVPIGHPTLKSFIGIPVFSGKQLIGMIGLANRADGYSEEVVEYLRPLTASCATFIIGYRLEMERTAMLQRIADSDALARDVIALAPTGLIYETADRKIAIVNRSFLNLFDLPGNPDDFVGRSCPEVMQSLAGQLLNAEIVLERVEQLVALGESVPADNMEFPDGRRYSREFLVMQSNDTVRGYLWRHRDITRKEFTRATDESDLTVPGSHI